MPTVYRSMLKDGDYPAIGNSAKELGVRVPPDPFPDVRPDADGIVLPGTGGMSVAPEWRKLPGHRIPARLQAKVASATGNNALSCWRLGEGPFQPGPMTQLLMLRPDSVTHGFIEPIAPVSLEDYGAAIAETQSKWLVDEE